MPIDFSLKSHPFPTADVVVINRNEEILLVKRRNPPHGFALPGGFIEYNESAEAAAIRELREETSLRLSMRNLKQFRTYSHPRRDPRFHTITVVFYAAVSRRSFQKKPKGGDDALSANWFPLKRLPRQIAFDHRKIIADFLKYRRCF